MFPRSPCNICLAFQEISTMTIHISVGYTLELNYDKPVCTQMQS